MRKSTIRQVIENCFHLEEGESVITRYKYFVECLLKEKDYRQFLLAKGGDIYLVEYLKRPNKQKARWGVFEMKFAHTIYYLKTNKGTFEIYARTTEEAIRKVRERHIDWQKGDYIIDIYTAIDKMNAPLDRTQT